MADLLTPVLQEFVYPVMRDLGFKRKGKRLWYLTAPSGDVASIQVRSWPLPGVVSFFVESGVVTTTDQARVKALNPSSTEYLDPGAGLIWRRVKMPPGTLTSNFSDLGIWGFYPQSEDSAQECGSGLATKLRDEVGPELLRLLDRNALYGFIAKMQSVHPTEWLIPNSLAWAELNIWLDEWPVERLQERWLELFGNGQDVNSLAKWLKKQILARTVVG
jgi:hypothetical protein